jgi:hypothetical protein
MSKKIPPTPRSDKIMEILSGIFKNGIYMDKEFSVGQYKTATESPTFAVIDVDGIIWYKNNDPFMCAKELAEILIPINNDE